MSPHEILSYLSSTEPHLKKVSAHRLIFRRDICYFFVIANESQITCFLRMNTINDNHRYKWIYADAPFMDGISVETFCAPLKGLLDELEHLEFAWECQSERYANGTYIKGSLLYNLPIYDGKMNYTTISNPNCMGFMPYILSLSSDDKAETE